RHYVAPTRPNCLPHTYLARSLRDGHEHDIHHADAAYQEPNSGDRDCNQANVLRDAVELFDHLVRRAEIKVVGFSKFSSALASQNLFHLIEPLGQPSGPRTHEEHHKITPRKHFARRFERDEDRAVLFVFPEKAAFAFVEHADNLKGLASELDLLTGYLELIRKQCLGNIDANHHDLAAVLVIDLAD